MTAGKTLCLNMIVKNEMANLERCLSAVAPYIACWVIGDTGSTDGTQEFIRSFFAARNIPGELHTFPFENFEQARNAALDCAAASPVAYDYLLFADADMELVVEDSEFGARLEAPGYRLIQRAASGLTYWNTRLVRRDAGARYHGVTHEYLDVPGGVKELQGVWYKDHASGANRKVKFERDIRLLSAALEKEPGSHRYWFYLAQSYRDAGRTAEAAEAYAKRAAMGGWDEEAWYARLQEARCLRQMGDVGGFVRQALAAFNQRPQRAEPLYDLARFYRERGMNAASVMFAEQGLAMKQPDQDILFLEDFVYQAGFQEEFSIAANYARAPAQKDRGFAACNWLALNRTIPERTRNLAISNLHFYIESAAKMMPSFAARQVGFAAPAGYRPTNPSIARQGNEFVLVQQTVNYTIDHAIPDGDDRHYTTPNGAPVNTRNFLLRLDDDLAIRSSTEILPPEGMPAWPVAQGFEDLRPFVWRDGLWCIGCVRELTREGWCEQVLARIEESAPGLSRLADWRVLQPEGPREHQKNWMPRVSGDALQFIYRCDPTRLVDDQARTVAEAAAPIQAEQFRGGSQLVVFDGGWLALVHEAKVRDKQRHYRHRFVWFDQATKLRGVSRPFFFAKRGVEFAAGLAWHPDGKRLVVTYGVEDAEAWIATVDADDVQCLLEDAERLPSGRLQETELSNNRGRGAIARAMMGSREIRETCGDHVIFSAGPGENPLVLVKRPDSVQARRAAVQDEQRRVIEPDATKSETIGDCAGRQNTTSPATPGDISGVDTPAPINREATAEEKFLALAPFLRAVDSPKDRREQSRAFDERIAPFISDGDTAALPQIHCFYEVMSETAKHASLIAATQSMRAAGHPVRVWSYAPAKLDFLTAHGVELRDAADVIPKSLFERIVARSEIRYFSDIFRYAALYEHGGLWMDTDVVMLRPFPFRGDYFFNLQWRGGHKGHFICGNVIYAEPYSRHMRALYEQALERFFAERGTAFGDIGPKLLSDYLTSDEGSSLQERLFSPMFFNPIDWTELDRFDRPVADLGDYLNDERIIGIHLWNARTHSATREGDGSLIAMLSNPRERMPSFTSLADRFNTDKNRHTGNRHCYARVYDRLLGTRRFGLRRLMEIGLCRGLAEKNQSETPSVALWQSYFPFCHVVGVDLTDFSQLNNERFTSFVCDQSKRDDLRAVAAKLEPGSFDVIIDDGSHASADEQLTLVELFPLLADGGWFFIEDLDWQPPGEDRAKIALTKTLLREIDEHGAARSLDPLGVSAIAAQFAEILFFDSHYELNRARLMGGLVAIRKRGGRGS